jgi:hypothetical protein
MKIIEFKNSVNISPFAPSQSIYYIGEKQLENVDITKLVNFCLNVEQQMCPELNKNINYFEEYEWGLRTGNIIGKNSYNFFNFKDAEISILFEELKKNFLLYLKHTQTDILPSYIDCGINIMRKGESIPIHLHDIDSNAFITGTIALQVDNTYTNFVHPCNQINKSKFIEYKSKNEIGKITFFPSCLPHYVETYFGNQERVMLSFDIISRQRDVTNIENYKERLIEFT